MRIKQVILTLVLCILLPIGAKAYPRIVTQNDALLLVQRQFSGLDVDFYYLEDPESTTWTFFVDAEPMKGWEHECYKYDVPKSVSDGSIPFPSRTLLKLPPEGNYVPIDVKQRYGSNSVLAPVVEKRYISGTAKEIAGRTYAVILNGGYDKLSNFIRYWNDCSFIYQTLVNRYGVPEENIYPIMSDGDNPEPDMNPMTGGSYISQPLDLDNDGVNDITLAATRENVRNVLNSLRWKLKKDDHLFIYVIDHGGSYDEENDSYICLWNHQTLDDTELATLIEPIVRKSVNVNVLLGQCFAGGFNDNLTKVGCVVASACTGSESSWACPDIPYDEFVYQWTCAVNGADHKKVRVNADTDGNYRVSMLEAFKYAKANDRVSEEHPRYVSTPASIGEDLAFNNLPLAVDLYVKDNPADTGKEPNKTEDRSWVSPSIWVRNEDDSIPEHENPYYSHDHQMAYIYVTIHNRGKEDYTGGKFAHMYWGMASTGLTPKVWKGREVYRESNSSETFQTGGMLESGYIDSIPAGGSRTVKFKWPLPNVLERYPDGNFHFCLLCKIMDTPYDDGYVDGKTYFDVLGKNDQAQRNVTIINSKDCDKAFNVFVRNTLNSSSSYSLELVPSARKDEEIFSKAKIEMEMSPVVYSAWERGGCKGQDIETVVSGTGGESSRKVRMLSKRNSLQDVSFNPSEFDVVKLRFNFNPTEDFIVNTKYTLDLIQKDGDGNIIGGETFIVNPPVLSFPPINIQSNEGVDGNIELSVEDSGYSSVSWYDSDGNNIGSGEVISVSPSPSARDYSVRTVSEEGEVFAGSITLDAVGGIDNVCQDSGMLTVNLKKEAYRGSSVELTPVMDGPVAKSTTVGEGEKSAVLDVSSLPVGVYVINYVINSVIIDTAKIVID